MVVSSFVTSPTSRTVFRLHEQGSTATLQEVVETLPSQENLKACESEKETVKLLKFRAELCELEAAHDKRCAKMLPYGAALATAAAMIPWTEPLTAIAATAAAFVVGGVAGVVVSRSADRTVEQGAALRQEAKQRVQTALNLLASTETIVAEWNLA